MRMKILLALALLCAAPPARADILIPGAPNITVASLLTSYSFVSGYPGSFLQPGNNGGLLLTMDGTANYFALVNLVNTNNTGGYSAGVGDFIDMFIVVYNARQEVTAIGSNGSYQTAAYINANGHYGQNTPPYIYWILPSSDPSMYACYGDITGPCIQTRNSGNVAGTRNFDALDWQGNYSFSIDGNNHQLLMGRSSTYAAMDTFLSWPAAATFQFGGADAAAPVAQNFKFQDVVAGTTNKAGAATNFYASASTGNAAGGAFNFYVTFPGSSGTAQNAYTKFLTIDPVDGVFMPLGNFNLSAGAQYSWSSGGGIYSATYGAFGFSGGGYTVIVTNTAAGAWSLGNGTAGDYSGSLKLTSVITAPLTYAALPASPTVGQRAYITDGNTTTYYATVSSGGGSSKISVLYNGSNWVVD
jgi:hypothetical protein